MRIFKFLATAMALAQLRNNGTRLEENNNKTDLSPFIQYPVSNPYVLYD
jgi:hypothetical protein